MRINIVQVSVSLFRLPTRKRGKEEKKKELVDEALLCSLKVVGGSRLKIRNCYLKVHVLYVAIRGMDGRRRRWHTTKEW